jgi:hypothetical protein
VTYGHSRMHEPLVPLLVLAAVGCATTFRAIREKGNPRAASFRPCSRSRRGFTRPAPRGLYLMPGPRHAGFGRVGRGAAPAAHGREARGCSRASREAADGLARRTGSFGARGRVASVVGSPCAESLPSATAAPRRGEPLRARARGEPRPLRRRARSRQSAARPRRARGRGRGARARGLASTVGARAAAAPDARGDRVVTRRGVERLVLPGLALFFVAHAIYLACVAEDAHITFRFARNVASGHGFVWNVGEAPVEGYANFLCRACAPAPGRRRSSAFSQVVGRLRDPHLPVYALGVGALAPGGGRGGVRVLARTPSGPGPRAEWNEPLHAPRHRGPDLPLLASPSGPWAPTDV